MTASDRTARRLLVVVAAVLVGTVVVVGGVSSAGGGSDGPALPGFAIDVDITVPMVTFDAPDDAGNETTPRPGVSPLPVVPDDRPRPDEGVSHTGHYPPA
jgi:hypothetical protein